MSETGTAEGVWLDPKWRMGKQKRLIPKTYISSADRERLWTKNGKLNEADPWAAIDELLIVSFQVSQDAA